MRRLIVTMVAAIMCSAFTFPAQADESSSSTRVNIMGAEAVLPVAPATTLLTAVPMRELPADIPLAFPVIIDPVAIEAMLRATPPDVLIDYEMGEVEPRLPPAVIEHFKYIACREGGLDKGSSYVNGKRVNPCLPQYRLRHSQGAYGPACGADNPISSASGLFQFMGSWSGWGGYSWHDIVSRDCLTDVKMAKAVYLSGSKFGPWGG